MVSGGHFPQDGVQTEQRRQVQAERGLAGRLPGLHVAVQPPLDRVVSRHADPTASQRPAATALSVALVRPGHV